MHPPSIWIIPAWNPKFQYQLRVFEIGFNPLCQLWVGNAINLKVAGLAFAMV